MRDVYDAIILCGDCHKPTERITIERDGFKIRGWKCVHCNKQWYHPGDMAQYEDYLKLKQKQYEVKLRMVGNSWAVSIPKEIIQFEEVHTTKTVRMSLDEPGKISITFTKISKIQGGK